MISLRPFMVVWILMAIGVLVLLAKRRMIASQEDDSLHVMDGGTNSPSHQAEVAQKLEHIDKWGKTLTIIAIAYGLLLTAAWVYQAWVSNARAGV